VGAQPLRETTSAAYGVGRDSIADALAERCPTQPFPKRNRYREACRREKLCTARADFWFWALSGLDVGVSLDSFAEALAGDCHP